MTRILLRAILLLCASAATLSSGIAVAQEVPQPAQTPAPASDDVTKYPGLESFEATVPSWFPKLLGAQTTIVNQTNLPFHSAFSGQQSLNANGQNATTQTRSAYFGAQITDNLSAYLDMDWFLGEGLHGGSGLAGFANGEVVRSGSVNTPKKPYAARAFAEYMLPLSGETAEVVREMDQLPGHVPVDYLIGKGGLMSAGDDFDTNRYANNARVQFLNFSLINNTAWDYAADTRGYTWGAMVGIVHPGWALKIGSYAMPKVANGLHFDTGFSEDHGDNIELSLKPLPNSDTTVRLLAYVNHGRMGKYTAALANARGTGTTPDIGTDNAPGHTKYGLGINAEVPIADDGNTGAFFRAGWSDGRTSNFAFTDVDAEVSGGVQLSGVHWGRDDDWVGLGLAANFLSNKHKDYLAAGGIGLLIGDGALVHYAPEEIVETYYSAKITGWLRFSPDYQFVNNPAYNADRGPVHIFAVRLRASM